MRKKAKKLDKKYRKEEITLTLTLNECILILDALAGFKETNKWYDVYTKVGIKFFDRLDDIDRENSLKYNRRHLVPEEERGYQMEDS